MPKSKLKSHHNGHAVPKGKGSIYQRSVFKREEDRLFRRDTVSPEPVLPPDAANTPAAP